MAKFEKLKGGWRAKDITGQRFGNLVVTDFSHRVSTEYATRIFWNCKCDCGNNRKVNTYHLTNNEVKSCGRCQYTKANRNAACKNKLPPGEGAMKSLYRSYKSNAKQKNRIFNISFEEFKIIASQNCHYSGTPPSIRHLKKGYNGPCKANGMDRIDSSKGYTLDNVVPCCSSCNTMKLDMSYDEFRIHIKKIQLHLGL